MKLISFLIFFFYSCEHKGDLTKQNIETIEIKIDKNTHQKENTNLFRFLENPRFVKLETHPKALIRRIDKVIQYKGNLFVFDLRFSALYKFNTAGKFIKKISKEGQGPGELNQIKDFEIDTLHKEILLIGSSLNTIHLDLDGNFLHNDYKEELYPDWLTVLGDRKYAYYASYYYPSFNNLIIYDLKANTEKDLFPYDKNIKAMAFENYGTLKRNFNGALYSDAASSIIHQVHTDGSHYPKYYIKSYKYKAWAEDRKYDLKSFVKEKFKISKLTNIFQETERALIYKVTNKLIFTKYIFFKESKQLYGFENYIEKSHFFTFIFDPPVGLSYDDKFISVISLGKYTHFKNTLKKTDEDLLIGDNPLYPILRNSAPDDNPILCIYDVKEPKNGK